MKTRILGILFTLVLLAALVATPAAAGNQGTVWHVPDDFATIQDAIDSASVADGDIIIVAPGNHYGAFITKSVTIKGEGSAVISDGPLHPAGLSMGFRLMPGSSSATISHLQFEVDLAIMNGAAVNDVTVEHCTFIDTIQAVSNWRGNRWVISQNKITDLRTRNGGGIGILIGDYTGGIVNDNLVFNNKITGTLHVWDDDGGGYNGSGIVIYADFRWGSSGANEIACNRVVKNTVSLASDTPLVVDVVAFELTDTRDDVEANPYPVIFDNAIGFNDFRGTVNQMVFTPAELIEENDISRNLGDNRGHGLHPSTFGPGLSWSSYDGCSESAEASSKEGCTTIQDGTLYASTGEPLTTGYDEFGYNYQAHMFNGRYCDYDRVSGGEYCDVQLVMAWSDAWLSNTDCDGDSLLDRHYGYDSYIGSGAWCTNHQWGSYVEDGMIQTWNYFVKIVAAPADAYMVDGIWYEADGTEIGPVIWGSFAILQQVYNDTGTDEHGIEYLSPAGPGLGKW